MVKRLAQDNHGEMATRGCSLSSIIPPPSPSPVAKGRGRGSPASEGTSETVTQGLIIEMSVPVILPNRHRRGSVAEENLISNRSAKIGDKVLLSIDGSIRGLFLLVKGYNGAIMGRVVKYP
jgi:hypothetical protein